MQENNKIYKNYNTNYILLYLIFLDLWLFLIFLDL